MPATEHEEIGRSPFERDVDRIEHTRAFRRLKDVTQVARAGESYLYHDRLSHSLKVAQVGRGLAQLLLRREIADQAGTSVDDETLAKLSTNFSHISDVDLRGVDESIVRQLDPEVVEAACLAHDIGHPPFGHHAEAALDEILVDRTYPDEFESADDDDIVNDIAASLPGKWQARLSDEIRTYLDVPEPPSEPLGDDATIPGDSRIVDDEGVMLDITKDELDPASDDFDPNIVDALARVADVPPPGIRFEGNAQSMRVATRLTYHDDTRHGLGLTAAVLAAILKYPYGRGEHVFDDSRSAGKFGYYETEADAFAFARDHLHSGVDLTMEADIMDYADDVTYAVHDLTDFYMDGRIPLDQLLRGASDDFESGTDELDKLGRKLADSNEFEAEAVHEVFSAISEWVSLTASELFRPFTGEDEQRRDLSYLTSYLVTYYLDANDTAEHHFIRPEKTDTGEFWELAIDTDIEEDVDILQSVTEHYVLSDSTLMAQQKGQGRLIEELFESLYDDAKRGDQSRSSLPEPYRSWLDQSCTSIGVFRSKEERISRVVADFIASMTERQAVDMHKRLTGDTPGSLQDEIIR